MKKIAMIALAVLFFSPAFSAGFNGIENGDNHIILIGGAGFPVSPNDGFKYDDTTQQYAKNGIMLGLQYLHYVAAHIGLGLEGSFTQYSDSRPFYFSDGTGTIWGNIKEGGQRYNLMALFKLNINPADRVRVYPIIGAGANYYKNVTKVEAYNGSHSVNDKVTTNSFMPAAFAGLGLEADLTELLTFGIEGRYNFYFIDKEKLSCDNSYLNEASALVRIGFRF
jgi:opacity protein-like surface antigen